MAVIQWVIVLEAYSLILTSKKTSRTGWLLVKVILMSVIKLGLSLGVGIGDMLESGGNRPEGNCPRTIVIDPYL